ncbi:MAG: sodium/substrate symporter small subunit [Solibacillus sp.]
MRKIHKSVADAYFKEKNMYMAVYFTIWFIVSFGCVFFANSLTDLSILGFPFHYFMGSIGALATFIILLFINAIVGDKIDKKYGINEKKNEEIGVGSTYDH